MKICFPIEQDLGLESPVCGHFGSTPAFLVTDSETKEHQVLPNDNQHHAHGMCQPLRALQGLALDTVVVGGIGAGALMKLNAAGIRVFRAGAGTVAENLAAFQKGALPEAALENACGHHGPAHAPGQHGNGCARN